jgi:hypothetical protein
MKWHKPKDLIKTATVEVKEERKEEKQPQGKPKIQL